ncbi:MAG: phosphonate metabolism protein PhnM [Desulfosarcina sp.]|jgi:alpha-D-ribose 1-methylphosphonate 5-triphosphate diphosphatase
MSLLRVEDLNKYFKLHHLGGKNIYGFSDLSFAIAPGEVLALSGPSGTGKSSVLKCIYRTYLPSTGSIRYASAHDGPLDLAVLPEHHIIKLRRQELGYVSQFLSVLPRVTAADIVAEPLIQQGVPVEAANQEAKHLLGQLNIPCKLHDAYPVTFSGGEQQRVNIARGIISKPRLLLLDEPTASLDAASVQIVLDLLRTLTRQGTTIIMICHDTTVVEKMADTVIPMVHRSKIDETRFEVQKKDRAASMVIANGKLVLPDRVAEKTDLIVEGGKIAHIGRRLHPVANCHIVDAAGLWVLPGFIDLHSDAIEISIQPRPRAILPTRIALTELDKNLAACGITTMYHCVSFTGKTDNALRHYERAAELIREISDLSHEMLVRNRIHARYEILETDALPNLIELLAEKRLDLVSLMDHTPGQGQFRNPDYLYEYYTKATHLSREQVDDMIERRLAKKRTFDDAHIRELVQECHLQRLPIASHDDDTEAKVRWVHGMGVRISEFPVTLEAAKTARTLGMNVLMGAPNIIFGRSLSNNLSGRDAIAARCCNLIGSDYSPSSLLHAVFKMNQLALRSLPELIGMVSHAPARTMGQADRIGAIKEGLSADLVLVDDSGHTPRVIQTFVDGRQVYAGR